MNDATGLTLDGPHRFLTVGGRTGLNVASLNTKATVESSIPAGDRGPLSLWFCPLEDLGYVPEIAHLQGRDPYAFFYPLVSDSSPARDVENGYFACSGMPAGTRS